MNRSTFILNGVLVIIINNSIKSLIKFFNSIRIKLFFTILSIGLITIVLLSFAFISSTSGRYVTERKKELYRHANTIAISLVTTGFFTEEKNLSYLATIQASVPGRGVVIDASGVVQFDSNHLDKGRIYLTPQVISALNGKSSYYYSKNENIGLVTVPILDVDFETVLGAVIVSQSYNDINASLNQLISLTLLIGFVLIIIDIVISYTLSSSFNRPFSKMILHINRMRDGHINEMIDVKGNKEIEEIAQSFNSMIQQLESIETNRKQFVANVSHELKTPLSSVKVLAESLIHQPNVPIEIYQDFLNDINKEIDRETKIINDLLTLVTLDKKDNPLKIEEVVINELVNDVVKRLKPLASLKSIQIDIESNRKILAEIDETKFELVIMNLIENAIKYNVENGKIIIKLETDYKDFVLSIKDTGEGIPEESIELIFKRFYRVDKTRSRDTGGTGLGLSIVQKTVHMHKGSIKCISKVGEGSEFIIKIPLQQMVVKGVESREVLEDDSQTIE